MLISNYHLEDLVSQHLIVKRRPDKGCIIGVHEPYCQDLFCRHCSALISLLSCLGLGTRTGMQWTWKSESVEAGEEENEAVEKDKRLDGPRKWDCVSQSADSGWISRRATKTSILDSSPTGKESEWASNNYKKSFLFHANSLLSLYSPFILPDDCHSCFFVFFFFMAREGERTDSGWFMDRCNCHWLTQTPTL